MQALTLPPLPGRAQLRGSFASASHVGLRVGHSCRATRPDGSLLFVLLRQGLTRSAGQQMLAAVGPHIGWSRQRKLASGQKGEFTRRKDGSRSGYSVTPQPVQSAILGYMDRSRRMPFCRRANFAPGQPQVLARCLPALQQAEAAFARHAPDQHARQGQALARTHPAYVLPGTSFTTVTLNKNFRTAYHRDAGDLPEGFGVMTCLRQGLWSGAELVFAEYGVAVALDSLDILLFDPHELHGNLPLRLLSAGAARLTCVHYFRKNMVYCQAPAEEAEIAARHDCRQPRTNIHQASVGQVPCSS